MSREWKPGDVQVVLSLHPSRVQEFGTWLHRRSDEGSLGRMIAAQIIKQGHGARLAVIDPEDGKQVGRLSEAVNQSLDFRNGSLLADAVSAALADTLRSLTTSPKPDEPSGLGAVVEDAEERVYVNVGTAKHPWRHGSIAYDWREIDAVRVLSVGVTP